MQMAWRGDEDQLGDTAAVPAGGLRAGSDRQRVSFPGKGGEARPELGRGWVKPLRSAPHA